MTRRSLFAIVAAWFAPRRKPAPIPTGSIYMVTPSTVATVKAATGSGNRFNPKENVYQQWEDAKKRIVWPPL